MSATGLVYEDFTNVETRPKPRANKDGEKSRTDKVNEKPRPGEIGQKSCSRFINQKFTNAETCQKSRAY